MLYFIRHGETDWNVEGRLQGQRDVPLNATGRRQASEAGVILRDLMKREGRNASDLAYWASPLVRARVTMELVREALGLDPHSGFQLDDRLRELTFGQWEGFTLAEVGVKAPASLEARQVDKWRFVPPGGESYQQLCARVRTWYDAIEDDTVVVAHGGTARALTAIVGAAAPDEAPSLSIGQGVVYSFADGQMTCYG